MPDPFIDHFVHPIQATLQAEARRMEHAPPTQPRPVLPFVTISRQAGAGGRTLARHLVERLNAIDAGPEPWTNWDRELVEKVATEQHLPESLIQSLEDSRQSWLQEFLDGLSLSDERPVADEFKVYRRVAATIRALAQLGRTVIVGRGGVYLTAKMPGGVHIRLVAPLEHRIKNMVKLMQVTPPEAARQVRQIERSRRAFYRCYWPGKRPVPEVFTLTINSAAVENDDMVDCIIPLVLGRYQPRRETRVVESQT